MGVGIIIYLSFLIPFSIVVFIIWILTYLKWKSHLVLYFLISVWVIFIGLILLVSISGPYRSSMSLLKEDIYGEYVIDRTKFAGKQAEWQYEHFRFELTEEDQMIFKEKIYDGYWKSDTVNITFSSGYYDDHLSEYCNQKIRIQSDSTNHHIIHDNPTLFRKRKHFYYVFDSEKFDNVFFIKKKWAK